MAGILRAGDVVRASTWVDATPREVYEVVADVTRYPEWSPECVEASWVDESTFRGRNQRRFAKWTTSARVVVREPGSEFAFVVESMGGDFTRWTYRIEPSGAGSLLTQSVEMCVDLPRGAIYFERLFLRVRDRAADLQGNLDSSIRQIRQIVEIGRTSTGRDART